MGKCYAFLYKSLSHILSIYKNGIIYKNVINSKLNIMGVDDRAQYIHLFYITLCTKYVFLITEYIHKYKIVG